MIDKALIICLLLISQLATAELKQSCKEIILTAVASELGLNKLAYSNSIEAPVADGHLIIAAECKTWPWDTEKIIAAIAYYKEGQKFNEHSNADDSKNIVLAIVNAKSGQVLSSGQWISTRHIGPGSLNIDTARYDFAPGVRAFGLDIFEKHRHMPIQSGQNGERTLYIEEGKNLKPVLQNFTLTRWQIAEEPKLGAFPEKRASIRTAYHIILDQKKTNGFRNLIIKKSVSYEMADPKQKVRERKTSVDRVLYFNGAQYVEHKDG